MEQHSLNKTSSRRCERKYPIQLPPRSRNATPRSLRQRIMILWMWMCTCTGRTVPSNKQTAATLTEMFVYILIKFFTVKMFFQIFKHFLKCNEIH